jgi:hypothetical protein
MEQVAGCAGAARYGCDFALGCQCYVRTRGGCVCQCRARPRIADTCASDWRVLRRARRSEAGPVLCRRRKSARSRMRRSVPRRPSITRRRRRPPRCPRAATSSSSPSRARCRAHIPKPRSVYAHAVRTVRACVYRQCGAAHRSSVWRRWRRPPPRKHSSCLKAPSSCRRVSPPWQSTFSRTAPAAPPETPGVQQRVRRSFVHAPIATIRATKRGPRVLGVQAAAQSGVVRQGHDPYRPASADEHSDSDDEYHFEMPEQQSVADRHRRQVAAQLARSGEEGEQDEEGEEGEEGEEEGEDEGSGGDRHAPHALPQITPRPSARAPVAFAFACSISWSAGTATAKRKTRWTSQFRRSRLCSR